MFFLFPWEVHRLGTVLRSSHLAGRDELQRAQGDLEVGSVGLEVEESLSNVLLKLGGVLPRRAVGGDLVHGLGAHLDWRLAVSALSMWDEDGRDGQHQKFSAGNW